MSDGYWSRGCRDGRITGRCRKKRWMMYRRNYFEAKLEGLYDHWCFELAYREFTEPHIAVGCGCDEGWLN